MPLMNAPLGLCQCGCGERTRISPYTRAVRSCVKGQPMRFVVGHRFGRKGPSDYAMAHGKHFGRKRKVHQLVAELALGRPLPAGAVVHHVNGDELDNRPANLVICQDQAYHLHLHQRQRAKAACGNPDWMRCPYCRQYGPANEMRMTRGGRHAYHPVCENAYRRERYQLKKPAPTALQGAPR